MSKTALKHETAPEAKMPSKVPSKRAAKRPAEPAHAVLAPAAVQVPAAAAQPPVASTAVALATAFSPPELLHAAILKGADVEVIERLSALAERWQIGQDTRRARISFDNAMADAKAEMPVIRKNRRVKFKANKPGAADTDYWHEDLSEVVDTVQGVFGKHGLFFRWRTAQPAPGQVTVVCILSHRDGHSEETELTAAVDQSGNKNHIQAIKSVATYLERMTLLAAAGVAARGSDDDGRAAGRPAIDAGFPGDNPPCITSDQVTALINECKRVGCPHPKFLDWAKVATFEEILASEFDSCMGGLSTFVRKAS